MSTQKDNGPYPIRNSFLIFLNFIIGAIALFCIAPFLPWAMKMFFVYKNINRKLPSTFEEETMRATQMLTSYVAFIGILATITFFFFVFKYLNKNK